MYLKFTESEIKNSLLTAKTFCEACEILKIPRSRSSTIRRYALKFNIDISHYVSSRIVQRDKRICQCCSNEFVPKDRYGLHKQRFCSRRCSNKFIIRRVAAIRMCSNCNKNITMYRPPATHIFCSSRCLKEFKFKVNILPRFEKGKISNRLTLKKVLTKLKGYKCFDCGLISWKHKPISLELDHIDGNTTNDFPINLRLLCPNCHSQTPTWKARNKGFGRGSRGISLG